MINLLSHYSKYLFTFFFNLGVLALLAGCGGNSDSDSGGATAPERQIVVLNSATLDDSSQIIVDASAHADDLGNATATSDFDGLTAVYDSENNIVTLTTEELDRPSLATVTLTNSEGEVVGTLQVGIHNPSGLPFQQEAAAWIKHSDDVLSLREDEALLEVTLLAAYISGGMNADEQDALAAQWAPEQSTGFEPLQTAFSDLESTADDYRSGLQGEGDLNDSLIALREAVDTHQKYSEPLLMDAESKAPAVIVHIDTQLRINSIDDTPSRLIENPAVGTEVDGGWIFDNEVRYLGVVTDINALAVCHGERL